jgi:hypothetical protein
MKKSSNNKIAIFPLNDYYIAKKIIAKERSNFLSEGQKTISLCEAERGNFSQKNKKLFAIEFVDKNNIQYWDLNAFRPDPRDYKDFMSKLSLGCKIIVLYERIGENNILIPRYIIWNSKLKDIGIVYFANVR